MAIPSEKYVDIQTNQIGGAGTGGGSATEPSPGGGNPLNPVLTVNGQKPNQFGDLSLPLDQGAYLRSVAGNQVVVASNGYPAPSRARGTKLVQKHINVSSFGSTGSGVTFNQRREAGCSGPTEVEIVLEFANSAAFNLSIAGIAAGRNGEEVNPLNTDGTPATWVNLAEPIAVPIVDPDWTTNGKVTRVKIPFVELDIPPGGAVYFRCMLPQTVAGYVGATGSRPISDWQRFINAKLPRMRYWANHASGNYVTVNQGAMPAGTSNSEFSPSVEMHLRPRNLSSPVSMSVVGDSTRQQLQTGGSGNPQYNPYNFNWVAEVVGRRKNASMPWSFINAAYEGYPAARFLNRFLALMESDMSASGDIAILQIFSINGSGFSNAVIDSNILLAQQITDLRASKGKTTIWTTTFPVKNIVSGAQYDAWVRGNRLIRQSNNLVFDAAAVPITTADNTHLTLEDTMRVADELDQYLISLGY